MFRFGVRFRPAAPVFPAVFAAAVVLGLGLLGSAPPARAAHERLKKDDSVRFALQTNRGRLDSNALQGRTYAVVFWNAGSKKFADALPDLRRLVKNRSEKDFVLIGYNVDDSAGKVQRAIAEAKMTWPQARHEGQEFPFYDLFYTRRSPVPGAFLVSDTGTLRWFGPLSRLVKEVESVLPPREDVADPLAAGRAAGRLYRALLPGAPDPPQVLERLRDIPDAAWEQDRGVRLTLRRAARRLTRLDEKPLFALRQAAAARADDAERFERLWTLRPERRPEEPDVGEDSGAATDTPAPDPSADAAEALEAARGANAQGDLLIAWERYRAAANDPNAGAYGPVARAELQLLEASAGFAERLAAERRDREASDLYVKALNLMAAGKPDAADATLREIRRTYYDTDTAAAAERALAELKTEREEAE